MWWLGVAAQLVASRRCHFDTAPLVDVFCFTINSVPALSVRLFVFKSLWSVLQSLVLVRDEIIEYLQVEECQLRSETCPDGFLRDRACREPLC